MAVLVTADVLSGNILGPGGATALAPCLAKLTQLQTLKLEREWIVFERCPL